MFARIKKFPLVRAFYKLPGFVWFYHFLWAWSSAALYGYPSRHIFVIGVTGTKGKTTVIELLSAILEAAGKKTAILSSLRMKIAENSEKNRSGNTMPGRFYIQRFLRRAIKAGCNYALVEVTSQGVALNRHRFINWNMGVLTNLHPEHIESHGSFEKYRKAKLRFLRYVTARRGKIFLNKEDESAKFFSDRLIVFNPTLYSRKSDEVLHAMPSDLQLRGAIDEHAFVWSDFNRDNAAAAIAVALKLGIDIKTIAQALQNFRGVPGRMEFIRRGGITAVVDYAHTPQSLEAVYKTLRAINSKSETLNSKLICVLGSAGGGRDKWKRPEMGKITAEYCDEIILTSEDPYDENPAEIAKEIEAEFLDVPNSKFQTPNSYRTILDRREAINKAVDLARGGDTVVITGIGSQEFMHFASGKRIPWNERKIVEDALARKR